MTDRSALVVWHPRTNPLCAREDEHPMLECGAFRAHEGAAPAVTPPADTDARIRRAFVAGALIGHSYAHMTRADLTRFAERSAIPSEPLESAAVRG